MRTPTLVCLAASTCIATALLAACGGPQPPITAHALGAASRATSAQYAVLFRFKGGDQGQYPRSGLIAVNGALYGTTSYGGDTSSCPKGCGTVYSVTTSGSENTLYDFRGYPSDGQEPRAIWSR